MSMKLEATDRSVSEIDRHLLARETVGVARILPSGIRINPDTLTLKVMAESYATFLPAHRQGLLEVLCRDAIERDLHGLFGFRTETTTYLEPIMPSRMIAFGAGNGQADHDKPACGLRLSIMADGRIQIENLCREIDLIVDVRIMDSWI